MRQGVARLGLAGIALIAVAVAMTAALGGSVLGLGSLFGGDDDTARPHVTAALAPAAGSGLEASGVQRAARSTPRRRSRTPSRRDRRPSGPGPAAPVAPAPPAGTPPAPGAPPALPPPPPPGSVTTTLADAGKQLLDAAPPEARPLTAPVEQALDGLVKTCSGLPVCP